MKVGVILTHPTQFDIPLFKLGSEIFEVIYTDEKRITTVFDPELLFNVSWQENNLNGYNFEVVPKMKKNRFLLNKIMNEKYRLLIVNGYFKKEYLYSIFFGAIFCKKVGIRVDTTDLINKSFARKIYHTILFNLLGLFVSYFFVVSSTSKNYLKKIKISESKIKFYPYLVSDETFIPKEEGTVNHYSELKSSLNIPSGKKVIICVSKHSDREAPFDTIKAVKELDQSQFHLLLIGDGPLHDILKEFCNNSGLTNVSFVGYINYNILHQYYLISDLFVHDSHNEPWGVSVQEAMLCSLPVITSDKVGAAFDLIEQGSNGFVFPAGDYLQLKEYIIKSINLDRNLVQNKNKEILKSWTNEKTLNTIVSLL